MSCAIKGLHCTYKLTLEYNSFDCMPLVPSVIMVYSQISGNEKQHIIDVRRQVKTTKVYYAVSAHWKHLTERHQISTATNMKNHLFFLY